MNTLPTDEELQARRKALERELHRALLANRGVLLFTAILAAVAVILAFDSYRKAGRIAGHAQQLEAERGRVEEALWQSHLHHARAVLESGKPGARMEALKAIAEAARWRVSPELRDEAITALCRTDIGEESSFQPFAVKSSGPAQQDPFRLSVDPATKLISRSTEAGGVQCARLADGQKLWEIPGSGEPLVSPVVWSPDSRYVAFQDRRKLRVYQVIDQRLVFETNAAEMLGPHLPTAFSSDGRLFFAWVEGCGVLFDLEAGREVKRLPKFAKLYHAAFHPTRSWLSLVTGKEIEIWDFDSLRRIHTLAPGGDHDPFPHHAWSGDGLTLAAACEDSGIFVWDATTFNDPVVRYHVLEGHTHSAFQVAFDRSGDYLVSCALGAETRLWNPHHWRGEPLLSLSHGYGVRLSPDDNSLAMIRPNQGVGTRPVSVSRVMRRLTGPIGYQAPIRGLAFSGDERWIAGVNYDGLFVWDSILNRVVARTPVTGAFVVLFRSKGSELLLGSESGVRRQPWNVVTNAAGMVEFRLGTASHIPLPGGDNKALKLALSRDESHLVASDQQGEGYVFDLDGDKPPVLLRGQAGLDMVAFSPDGTRVASGTWQGAGTWVWDAANGKPLHKIDAVDSDVGFTADGQWLVISRVAEHAFWHTQSNAVVKTLPREPGEQTGGRLALFPDGRTVALTESFKRVQLVDIASLRILANLVPPGDNKVEGVHVSPAGRWLALRATHNYLYDIPQLRRELARLGLNWDAGNDSAFAPEVSKRRISKSSEPLAVAAVSLPGYLVAVVLAGLVAALGLGGAAQRYQRHLLASYFELEAVSARRHEALLRAQAELQQSQKMKALGTLAAGIAHDFNNLLSVIRMANQLTAEHTPGDADLQENTGMIEQSVAQGKAVVRSMLGYSRAPAERAPFVVNDAVRETALLLNQQFLRGIQLRLDLDAPVPPVLGVRSRLEQILLNLVVNSAEAMAGKGELRLAVRRIAELPADLVLAPRGSDGWVEITVADTGPGITAETPQRIFEPFFTTKQKGATPGTGLGLSMVHAIAEGEGYGLALESVAGTGTTFQIFVPQS